MLGVTGGRSRSGGSGSRRWQVMSGPVRKQRTMDAGPN